LNASTGKKALVVDVATAGAGVPLRSAVTVPLEIAATVAPAAAVAVAAAGAGVAVVWGVGVAAPGRAAPKEERTVAPGAGRLRDTGRTSRPPFPSGVGVSS
jgi:hypothetical protein